MICQRSDDAFSCEHVALYSHYVSIWITLFPGLSRCMGGGQAGLDLGDEPLALGSLRVHHHGIQEAGSPVGDELP